MKEYSKRKEYSLYHGSMLDMQQVIESNSIDAIVTDPPYELGFMGKSWDNSGIAFQKETWKKCLDVLKPGGYMLAFGGSRTFHRIACAIEDAGFEIRDTIMWVYSTGFPKSMNIGLAVDKKMGVESKSVGTRKQSGAKFKLTQELIDNGGFNDSNRTEYEVYEAQNEWNGWGTALKPSYEPVIVARKPCEGSTIDNVLEYGVGGINIDGCKLEDSGRYPANLILTYDDSDYEEVCGGFPVGKKNGSISRPYKKNNNIYGKYGDCNTFAAYDDSGSAARYYYCAKASKKDRDDGLDALEMKYRGMSNQAKAELERGNNVFDGNENTIGLNRVVARKNDHPCVKPTELMQYLIRLVTPNGGTILDPFNGAGSTGKAVMYENKERNKDYKYIGIELDEHYLEISKGRIDYAMQDKHVENTEMEGQISIYDYLNGEL
jgi:site-specific DNA-methyltransferase (adenine-specific)